MKPSALAKPLTASAAWDLPSKCEKKTRPWRKSSLILTEVRVTPRRRGSRRSRSSISDNSRRTISATRPGRLPSLVAITRILASSAAQLKRRMNTTSLIYQQFRSVAENFELLIAQRSQCECVDKFHDLAQGRVDEGTIATDLADPEFGALPHIVMVGFRDRNVELVAH